MAGPVPPLTPPTEPLTDGVITLRPWLDDDAAARAAAFSDPEIVRWTDLPETYTADDAAHDIRRARELQALGERITFAIVDAAGEVIGGIDVMLALYERAELGYVVGAAHRRRGYATRAVRLLSTWTFDALPVRRIELPVPLGNVASAGVARRAGFTPEGTLQSFLALRDGGPRYDVTMFALVGAA